MVSTDFLHDLSESLRLAYGNDRDFTAISDCEKCIDGSMLYPVILDMWSIIIDVKTFGGSHGL